MAVRQDQGAVYDSMQITRPWRALLADQLALPADDLGPRHLHFFPASRLVSLGAYVCAHISSANSSA